MKLRKQADTLMTFRYGSNELDSSCCFWKGLSGQSSSSIPIGSRKLFVHLACVPLATAGKKTCHGSGLTHHAPVEELETSPEGEDERSAERQQHPADCERWQWLPVKRRHHRVPHAFGGVGERVE